MANVQNVTLAVPEISCEHCVHSINAALSTLEGVESVSTDIPTKTVHLRYDPVQLSLATVEATLDDAGYTVANVAK